MVKWDNDDVNKCSYVDVILKSECYIVEPVAAVMNAGLFAALAEGVDPRIMEEDEAFDVLETFLGDTRYHCIGKNASTFDLPFLEAHGFEWKRHFKHRVLDAGSLFATPEGVPSLTGILDQLGECPVSGELHQAAYDARVTLWAVQQALKGTVVL
jgi:hypothetical protein